MKYNLYTLTKDSSIQKIESEDLEESIKIKLEKIQIEIIAEYKRKQEGRIGIRSLGKEIRQNKIIKNIFSKEDKNVLIKMTENRRSFIKVFIENLYNQNDKSLFYMILQRDFGNKSNLVDKSFADISDIRKNLSLFFKYFNSKNNLTNIFFIEITAFQGYDFEQVTNITSKLYKL
ncbi:MAG: hypothetical protein CMD15_02745 [Flavobacteriales bacterium]|nr:hypothetical protein [Flavobacteriales bacterium]|tara:strand:+ start:4440 stop:4964 length:525 start_codon:yes stop_codon:yes gene_type:complete